MNETMIFSAMTRQESNKWPSDCYFPCSAFFIAFDVRSSDMIFFFTFISFTGTWAHNWPTPNVSSFIVQLPVENRTGFARSYGWSLELFFRLLYTIASIATTTVRFICEENSLDWIVTFFGAASVSWFFPDLCPEMVDFKRFLSMRCET